MQSDTLKQLETALHEGLVLYFFLRASQLRAASLEHEARGRIAYGEGRDIEEAVEWMLQHRKDPAFTLPPAIRVAHIFTEQKELRATCSDLDAWLLQPGSIIVRREGGQLILRRKRIVGTALKNRTLSRKTLKGALKAAFT